jgi:peptidyl-prolyl cis-trans isomerase D
VDSASNITFNSSFIPGLGNEPQLIGTITTLREGDTSAPIIGLNGVYIAQVIRKSVTDAPPNVTQVKAQARSQRGFRTANKFAEALRHHAKIKDNRSTFY